MSKRLLEQLRDISAMQAHHTRILMDHSKT